MAKWIYWTAMAGFGVLVFVWLYFAAMRNVNGIMGSLLGLFLLWIVMQISFRAWKFVDKGRE